MELDLAAMIKARDQLLSLGPVLCEVRCHPQTADILVHRLPKVPGPAAHFTGIELEGVPIFRDPRVPVGKYRFVYSDFSWQDA